ncbi:hypothetical protein O181_106041 [Austropuccinia psidii MF-1]|uniref:Retrotransposon gag domain-containing protein n=1 Tax=Austropuccinia psidii MF-1 TaxID=1389203 RepID=A0A9Q3JQ78_9BASI|nr:hypothetical protein [Austropuccinia psidii MF-1]
MKEGGNVSLYIADFRSLVSRIGDWDQRAYIHHYRRGLASSGLDQLASNPSIIAYLQDLMDINLGFEARYHERQKEKKNFKKRRLKPQSQVLLILKILQAQVIRRRISGFRKGTSPIIPS